MGNINILDISIANLIAAGEVVDRPASAVKELMENSIDAQATEITVEIRNGGSSFLRVTDNGCGMDKEDAQACLKRHATSKIRSKEDLDRIGTLGFRGEALAAIASVSDFRMLTRRHGDEMGTLLRCEGGEIVELSEIGCPEGTTMIAQALFANVPARRKFLKKDVTETAAILATAEKVALSHPEIAIRVITDGKLRFATAGDDRLANAIHAVLGREIASKLIPVDDTTEGIRVWGFIASPECARGNRNAENFFLNGRYIKSSTASAALEQAFDSYRAGEKFPCSILNISIHPSLVDVNVHPAKLEVKFSNENFIFRAVYCAVRNALQQNTPTPKAPEILVRKTGDDVTLDSEQLTEKAKNTEEALLIAQEHEKLTGVYEQISAFEMPASNTTEPSQPPVPTDTSTESPTAAIEAPLSSEDTVAITECICDPITEQILDTVVIGYAKQFRHDPSYCIPDDYDPYRDLLQRATENLEHYPLPAPSPDAVPFDEDDIPLDDPLSTDGFLPDAPNDFGANFGKDLLLLEEAPPPILSALPSDDDPAPSTLSESSSAILTEDPLPPQELILQDTPPCEANALPSPSELADFPTSVEPPLEEIPPLPFYRLCGVAFHCYAFVELEDKLLLIDKHAAHERILFEHLKANMHKAQPTAQLLLLPLPIALTVSEAAAVKEYEREIRAIGFDFTEEEADGSMSLIQIPCELAMGAAAEAFASLAGDLAAGTATAEHTRSAIYEKALYQASCKAAVKAGKEDDEAHIRWIVEQVLTRPDIRFCPHGRPVAIELTRNKLEQLFHRT